MTERTALSAERIFDGAAWHAGCAVLCSGAEIEAVVALADLPDDAPVQQLSPGILVPGFVDLQVNGGGGVLLNEDPSVDSIRTMCQAHARFGTTALLPTLITDTPEQTERAIDAATMAAGGAVSACLGLHLEGPHLSHARRGAHDDALVRPASNRDIERLLAAGQAISSLLVTVAPESVTNTQISTLSQAGIRVSLGHSNADCATAISAMQAGASLVTHLFNAMSPLTHREPGMVGAALSRPAVHAGMIADGIHVDPAAMGIAIRAKEGPGRLFLVTDAMSTIGSDQTDFTLNGRTVYRSDGRLTLEDGTLAGADIDMIASIRVLVDKVGLELEEALRMASLYPARALGVEDRHGRIAAGCAANLVHISNDLDVRRVWIGSQSVYEAA